MIAAVRSASASQNSRLAPEAMRMAPILALESANNSKVLVIIAVIGEE